MARSKEQIGRTCPYCGAMFTYDEYFCRACHRKFGDPYESNAPSSHRPDVYVVALPKLYFSAALSVLGVGLGQFYNGDTLKGVAFFLAFLLVSFGYIVTPYQPQLFFGIWIAAMIEALYSAQQISVCKRSYAGISRLLWAELALLGLVALLHIMTGEPNLLYMGKLFPVVDLWMG
jgi:TM2 domain-containing membrane protein YozV